MIEIIILRYIMDFSNLKIGDQIGVKTVGYERFVSGNEVKQVSFLIREITGGTRLFWFVDGIHYYKKTGLPRFTSKNCTSQLIPVLEAKKLKLKQYWQDKGKKIADILGIDYCDDLADDLIQLIEKYKNHE